MHCASIFVTGMAYCSCCVLISAQRLSDTLALAHRMIPCCSCLYVFDSRNIDMGDNKTYFLCNLDDKIALAEMIDNVPMSFNNR